jgi:copper resistance protein C
MAWRRLAFSLVLATSLALDAAAHSSLIEAVPREGAVVRPGDLAIELRFDSRIDARFSRLTLIGADGGESPLTLRAGDRPGVVTATGTGLTAGSYLLHWRVLSADGHSGEGRIRFTVGR